MHVALAETKHLPQDVQCYHWHARNVSRNQDGSFSVRVVHQEYDDKFLLLHPLREMVEYEEMFELSKAHPTTLSVDQIERKAALEMKRFEIREKINRVRTTCCRDGWSAVRATALHIYLCYVCAVQTEVCPEGGNPEADRLWQRNRAEYETLSQKDRALYKSHLALLPVFAKNLRYVNHAQMLSLLQGAADTTKGKKLLFTPPQKMTSTWKNASERY